MLIGAPNQGARWSTNQPQGHRMRLSANSARRDEEQVRCGIRNAPLQRMPSTVPPASFLPISSKAMSTITAPVQIIRSFQCSGPKRNKS